MKKAARPAGRIRVQAPAKVNLYLRVLSRRRDGYHSLVTVFHTVGLWDDLFISPAPVFKFTSSGERVPHGPANLCVRAFDLLRNRCRIKSGAHIHLVKRIPAGAGLGGGSADAAACLLGLNRWLCLGLGLKDLLAHAARLGADVPFFIEGGAGLGRGRGERLKTLPSRLNTWAVILKPRYPVRTRLAYLSLDRRRDRRSEGATLDQTRRALTRGSLAGLRVTNDFTQVINAMHPKNRVLLDTLTEASATPAFLSGSGSAVVGIVRNEPSGKILARKLGRRLRVSAFVARLAPYAIRINRL